MVVSFNRLSSGRYHSYFLYAMRQPVHSAWPILSFAIVARRPENQNGKQTGKEATMASAAAWVSAAAAQVICSGGASERPWIAGETSAKSR
jgi:hypothetical protein